MEDSTVTEIINLADKAIALAIVLIAWLGERKERRLLTAQYLRDMREQAKIKTDVEPIE